MGEVTRILFVGAGGLGCASGLVLAESAAVLPPMSITVIDDDVVSADNLHRQLFFEDADVGRAKGPRFVERFLDTAHRRGAREVTARDVADRLVPDNARALIAAHDVVVEGADNFATKFLVADAARLERKPVIHAGVVRWAGYALSTGAESRPCYRCLFEDLPRDQPDTCAIAGVVGPLVALVGALQAELLIERLIGRATPRLVHVDALRGGALRSRPLRARADCPSCGERASLHEIDASHYVQPSCA